MRGKRVLIVAATMLAFSDTFAQTVPELARQHPSNPVVRTHMSEIFGAPLEQLSKDAPLVVVATLVFVRSYLSPDERHIFSDFRIIPEEVVAGAFPPLQPTPGPSFPPTLVCYGGELTFEGVRVRTVDLTTALPESGKRFLLFLKPFGTVKAQDTVYEGAIFRIDSGRLVSLEKQTSVFKDITVRSLDDVVHTAKASARK